VEFDQSLATVLGRFIERDGRKARQLDRKTNQLFNQGVSHASISRWLSGIVEKPRFWQDIVKLAIVLRLTADETSELLLAANQHPLPILSREAIGQPDDLALIDDLTKNFHPHTQAPFMVPPKQKDFVGRRKILNDLQQRLKEDGEHLLCLQGMAGTGKTTLALELAYQLRDNFPDGVLWVQFDQTTEPMSILYTLAEAYNVDVSLQMDLTSRSSKVRNLLAHKQALLILDNVEQDQDIRPLLPPTGMCSVIMTTRYRDLSVADQAHRFTVPPFNSDNEEALALFQRILGAKRAQLERQDLLALADLLGHLPLALSIAAYRLQHEPGWTTAVFLNEAHQEKQRLLLLSRGDQNVRLSFELSYQALPLNHQATFNALNVFAGSDFSVMAAAHVVDLPLAKTMNHLRQLYNLSLLQLGHDNRYRLHPLLRSYSRQHLEQSEENFAIQKRMVDFFIDYTVTHQTNHKCLDVDRDNIIAALNITLEQKMGASLVRGCNAFYDFLRTRGLYGIGQHFLQEAQYIANELRDWDGLLQIEKNLGHIAQKQGQLDVAQQQYQRALTLSHQLEDEQQISEILTKLGNIAYRYGNYSLAQHQYEQAMEIAKEVKDQRRQARLLNNLGLVANGQGNSSKAEAYYQQSERMAKQLDDVRLHITVLQNLGELVEDRGDNYRAREYLQKGLALAEDVGDPELISRLLGNLGLVALAFGNQSQAAAYFRRGLHLAQQSSLRLQICRQQTNLGQAAVSRQDYAQANIHFQEALSNARRQSSLLEICVILNLWGDSYWIQRQLAQTHEYFQEAQVIAQKGKFQKQIAQALFGLARVAAVRGDITKARRLGQESESVFMDIGHIRREDVRWWLAELPGEMA